MEKVHKILFQSIVSNYKHTPVSDATEYLGAKTNLTSTILQSTKKLSFRFPNILGIPPLC